MTLTYLMLISIGACSFDSAGLVGHILNLGIGIPFSVWDIAVLFIGF